jgi:hypothetical protein
MAVANPAKWIPLSTISGRRYWRAFLPIWLFPIGFLSMVWLPGFNSHPAAYLFALAFPLLSVCMYVAGHPYRRKQLSWSQVMLWAAVVPFLIWACLIGGIFAIAFVSGAI